VTSAAPSTGTVAPAPSHPVLGWAARRASGALPDFPWDSLTGHAATARRHPGGIADLSVGTPVDPTPASVQEALRAASDAPGYPATYGTAGLREAIAGWAGRAHGIRLDPAHVLPTVGSKELVALLPSLLGLGAGARVGFPTLAYPTYDVGARMAGAEPVAVDGVPAEPLDLLWLNSPANPTGAVATVDELRAQVAWARDAGVLLVSDECYLDLAWDAPAVSLLHPDVCGGSHEGLLVVHSLSKRSNLAGYRAASVFGDPAVIAALLEVRKHAGLIVPAPVQAAALAAYADDAHAADQRERYRARRERLRAAVLAAGFRIDHSAGGLYLWATRGESCWDTVAALAAVGLLVAPGAFYGDAGARHVRIALTATDERIDAACERLAALAG
jgi:succinyldiaminopimelate transaminase